MQLFHMHETEGLERAGQAGRFPADFRRGQPHRLSIRDHERTPPLLQDVQVGAFGDGYIEQIGGAYYAISLACLDDLDPTELAEAPVKYSDGRNNNWWNTPKETRHL